jgi:RNA polymerase sigma-70 factor (ECF subfamily)
LELAVRYEDLAQDVALRTAPASLEDEALVAGRRGDIAAFEELYRSHGRRMKSVARGLLGNASDAEDAVQEAFLKLHRALPTFKGESLLSSFLFRILVNTCHDMGRRRQRRPEAPEEEADQAPSTHRASADPALRATIERGLAGLPDVPRAVFVLFEVEGFTHREVGSILGIPEGTSKHALFVAKKHLQALLLGRKARS